jgi:hypothetical protein
MMRRSTVLFTGICLFSLLACKTRPAEPVEVRKILAAIDSLKTIGVLTQTIDNVETAENLNKWYLVSKDSTSGKLISYGQSSTTTLFTGYFGNNGKVNFIEISTWQKTIQYLEEYFLKDNTPFYYRKFFISAQDTTLQEEGEVASMADYWSFTILTLDEIQKMIQENALSVSAFQGKWFEVKEASGKKPYEFSRFCNEDPFNITIGERSISFNPGQMAAVFTILSTAQDENQLKMIAIDSLNHATFQVEIAISQLEPGVILFVINGGKQIMIHEDFLHLAIITNNYEGCDEL